MVAPVITIGIVGVLFGILQFLAARRGGSLLENFGAGGWVIAFEVLFAAGVFSGVIVHVLMTPYNVPVDWIPFRTWGPRHGALMFASILTACGRVLNIRP